MALAALRDARNLLLDYNREDEQIAGITRPAEVKKWFSKLGFTVLEDKTNIFFDASFKTLNEAIDRYRNNCSVCLSVHRSFRGK